MTKDNKKTINKVEQRQIVFCNNEQEGFFNKTQKGSPAASG